MEFKIDTKDNFTVIIPVADDLNAALADNIAAKCEETRQNGSNNFIIDLQHIKNADQPGLELLVKLHEDCYSNERSLVFTGLSAAVMNEMKVNETDLLLNVAPKMIEAIDIISMEILERDLLSEE